MPISITLFRTESGGRTGGKDIGERGGSFGFKDMEGCGTCTAFFVPPVTTISQSLLTFLIVLWVSHQHNANIRLQVTIMIEEGDFEQKSDPNC